MLQRLTKLFVLFALLMPGLVSAQGTVVVNGDVTANTTWTNNNTYVLDGRVFVTGGAELTIEPGTVVKGRAATDPLQAAALVITRGAKIFADGTAERPITFTAEVDDVAVPDDLTETDRGLWGGVVILGRARLNVAGGQENIEGISATDPRGQYGGEDDEDDSGVFRYVSIRHGGTAIGNNNELNGLSLGGVGRGTLVEHVEVFANQDDGFEFFGGTVDTRYLVSAYVGDDAFDYDEGFRGRGQFWFSIQDSDDAGSGGEFDGGTTPENGQPYAIPTIYNATFIGSGAASGRTSNDFALSIDDNAGGLFYNSIFTDFAGAAVTIEDDAATADDTWARFQSGGVVLRNNLFFGFGAGSQPADLFRVSGAGANPQPFVDYVTGAAQANLVADPMLAGISREANEGLDPRPASSSPALTAGTAPLPENDDFFVAADYRGAFGDTLWISGWTALSELGYLMSGLSTPNEPEDEVLASALKGSYPNPLHGQGKVGFQLDRAQNVRLAVYDVLGREVAVLVDGAQPAGSYAVPVDASRLAAGTYVYQLRTESGTFSKTMVVLK